MTDKYISDASKQKDDASQVLITGADNGANRDPGKQALRVRLEQQTQSEQPGGLDPIIAKGSSLIKDLDSARQATPQDKDYLEMRVKAGMNQVNAYVHAQGGRGHTDFAKEATQELTKLICLDPSLVSSDDFQRFAKMADASKDPAFVKASLRAKLETQTWSESTGGLDPIIVKGSSLIKELDSARHAAPQDSDYLEMRVKAGMNQVNAYVHAQDGRGHTVFAKEAKRELTTLMNLQPELVKDTKLKKFATMADAFGDAEFTRQFQKHGG